MYTAHTNICDEDFEGIAGNQISVFVPFIMVHFYSQGNIVILAQPHIIFCLLQTSAL